MCKWSENHLSKTSAQLRVCIALENFHGHTRGEQHKYCKISSWKPFFTSVDPKTSVKLFSCWRPSTNIAVWAGILNLALFIFAIYKCNWEGHKFSHAHVNSFTGKQRVPFPPLNILKCCYTTLLAESQQNSWASQLACLVLNFDRDWYWVLTDYQNTNLIFSYQENFKISNSLLEIPQQLCPRLFFFVWKHFIINITNDLFFFFFKCLMIFVADIKALQEHPPSIGDVWPSKTKYGLSQNFSGCSSTLRWNCLISLLKIKVNWLNLIGKQGRQYFYWFHCCPTPPIRVYSILYLKNQVSLFNLVHPNWEKW